MSETKRVRVTNLPLGPGLWTVGWMFTLGYMAILTPSETMTFWQTIGTLALSYVLWPLLLGGRMSGSLP